MKRKTTKKRTIAKKSFYVSVSFYDGEFTPDEVYQNEDDVKDNCSGGDTVYKVVAVKKYKVVDESIKLVPVKL